MKFKILVNSAVPDRDLSRLIQLGVRLWTRPWKVVKAEAILVNWMVKRKWIQKGMHILRSHVRMNLEFQLFSVYFILSIIQNNKSRRNHLCGHDDKL